MKQLLQGTVLTLLCLTQSCCTTPSTADPKSVAESFLQALLDGDQDRALSHVWREDRDEFRRSFSHGLPRGFPKAVEVEIRYKENSKGPKAGAEFMGGEQSYGVDMQFQDGRWWVTKK